MAGKEKRLDFLYDENAIKEENQEAYLLGKRFTFKRNDDDMRQLEDKGVAGSAFLKDRSQVTSYIDRQNKVFSDPMLAIQKRSMQERKKILMNKHTMKKLKAKFRSKKKKKSKKKKRKKKRRYSSSEDESSESDSDDSRSPKRRRDDSEESRPSKRRKRSVSESESESDSPPKQINPLDLYDKGTTFGLIHVKGKGSAALQRQEKAEKKKNKKKKKKKKKKKNILDYPTAWKKQGENVEKFIRSKPRWRTTIETDKNVKEMSKEEMELKVQAMELKANKQEHAREKALYEREREIAEERKQFLSRKYVEPDERTAQGFIHKMEKQAYGAGVDDDLEERLRKHQTRTQRGDINSASFLGGRSGGY